MVTRCVRCFATGAIDLPIMKMKLNPLGFRRHWCDPPPPKRTRPELGGTSNGANFIVNSIKINSPSEDVVQRAIAAAAAARRPGQAAIMRLSICGRVGVVLDTPTGCGVPLPGRP
jgi:hypothetical protein